VIGTAAVRLERISQQLLALLGTPNQITPFSEQYADFDLAEAYEIAARVRDLRQAGGETPIGRKIGFTNRAIWSGYVIAAPIWNYVFDRTLIPTPASGATFTPKLVPEPRIEPELVLHIARPPAPGMSDIELAECLDWIAPGYEIVYSIFPNWKFNAADAAAAYGVHGALLVGERLHLSGAPVEVVAQLANFAVQICSDAGVVRDGHARNVLGGPLFALKYLVDEIARFPCSEPLRADEIVTTGTLTEAMPAVPGDNWTAHFHGIALAPLTLRFT
jgi:2-oxo-3-hexenedioate decarboxylase